MHCTMEYPKDRKDPSSIDVDSIHLLRYKQVEHECIEDYRHLEEVL